MRRRRTQLVMMAVLLLAAGAVGFESYQGWRDERLVQEGDRLLASIYRHHAEHGSWPETQAELAGYDRRAVPLVFYYRYRDYDGFAVAISNGRRTRRCIHGISRPWEEADDQGFPNVEELTKFLDGLAPPARPGPPK